MKNKNNGCRYCVKLFSEKFFYTLASRLSVTARACAFRFQRFAIFYRHCLFLFLHSFNFSKLTSAPRFRIISGS